MNEKSKRPIIPGFNMSVRFLVSRDHLIKAVQQDLANRSNTKKHRPYSYSRIIKRLRMELANGGHNMLMQEDDEDFQKAAEDIVDQFFPALKPKK